MIKLNEKLKLGESISEKDIESWNGKNVIFDIPTGYGKTYFVINILQKHHEKQNRNILFVCNRKVLAEDVKRMIQEKKIKNIDVITYQSVESKLRINKNLQLNYDTVVLDEYHHVLETFNIYVDLSHKFFTAHPAQKIFMSATCDKLFEEFVRCRLVDTSRYYKIERNYDYVDKLVFYDKKNDYESIIEGKMKNKDEKIMFFSQSMDRLKRTYIKYRDNATFFCSSYTSDKEAKSFLKECEGDINDGTFNKQLICSSSAMDVGISIIEKSLSVLVVDLFSWETLIQCIGRKRIQDASDTVQIYIRNYHRGELNIQHNPYYNAMDLFVNNPELFKKTYESDRNYHNPYIFKNPDTQQFEVNEIAYFAFKNRERELSAMKNQVWVDRDFTQHRGLGYKNFILDKLNIERGDDRVFNYGREKEIVHMDETNSYLENMLDVVILTSKDRKELLEGLNFRNSKNNRLIKNRVALNILLEDGKYNYMIHEFQTSRIIDNKKKNFRSAWKVIRIEY